MEQRDLFPLLYQPVAEDEVARILTTAISRGEKQPREADLYLSTVCAEYLLDQLTAAGPTVVRRPARALRE
jgi:hypothetical protein